MTAAGPYLGIDLGSRTTKIVELEDGLVRGVEILDTTPGSLLEVRRLVSGRAFAASCVTGYGRHLASAHLPGRVVTEITPFDKFYPAEEYHQEYFARNPSQGYCQFIIAPKVAKFRKEHLADLKR